MQPVLHRDLFCTRGFTPARSIDVLGDSWTSGTFCLCTHDRPPGMGNRVSATRGPRPPCRGRDSDRTCSCPLPQDHEPPPRVWAFQSLLFRPSCLHVSRRELPHPPPSRWAPSLISLHSPLFTPCPLLSDLFLLVSLPLSLSFSCRWKKKESLKKESSNCGGGSRWEGCRGWCLG